MTITLATLPEATAQEVFDQVARHLHTQGKRSMNGADCRYRYYKLRCAAGCLIADNEYKRVFEKKSWGTLAATGRVPGAHEDLITQLQSVHDGSEPDEWPAQLRDVAHLHRLSPAVVDELWPEPS